LITNQKIKANATELERFESLFQEHYSGLTRYAFTFLKNGDEAEDMVQQIFVNFWEKNQWQQAHTSVKSLLYTAVHNGCLNKIKQEQVRLRYANAQLAKPDFNTHEEAWHLKEVEEEIKKGLETLPEQCKRIFELSRFQEMKYQEIADELNLSIKTVENQMGKALKLMRTHLKDYLPTLFLLLIN
jgi:RNA polymerase sigma-70 factor (family 1)